MRMGRGMTPEEAYQWLQEKLTGGEMWAVDIIMRAYREALEANERPQADEG